MGVQTNMSARTGARLLIGRTAPSTFSPSAHHIASQPEVPFRQSQQPDRISARKFVVHHSSRLLRAAVQSLTLTLLHRRHGGSAPHSLAAPALILSQLPADMCI